jgi:CheY-like chemotaxis protein
MELELGEFSLREALDNGLTMVKERAGRHGIALGLEVDPRIEVIEADERKVKQVVFNLLSNAVKFTPDGGRIELAARLSEDGDEVLISIRDTGIGIAAEDRERIFEEFRQAGRAVVQTQEGTGLGLALTRKFVELHGGRIWVESAVGAGNGLAAGPLVLLVEDDARAADLLTLYLDGAGYRVAVARDGEEGLDLARRLLPDGITLDIGLPKLDGWELLSRLKADPAVAEIPVVIVSMVDERGKGLALGAAEYLVKPVRRDELLATLRRFTPRRNGLETPLTVLAIDDDPLAIELIEATLEPRGYSVLKAHGGAEGVALAASRLPSLIVLDLTMPELDGFAVVERLRADPATAAIPIVILTSKSPSPEEWERLNGRISYLARKGEFDRAAFVELVRCFCPMDGSSSEFRVPSRGPERDARTRNPEPRTRN